MTMSSESHYQTVLTTFPTSITVEPAVGDATLPSHLVAAIDACWAAQKLRCGENLFDGTLFTVTHYSETHLSGRFIPYRWYMAWLYDPRVRAELPLCPLGVSGLTYTDDRVLLGKRASCVASFPNAYEFAPSGSVDTSCLVGDQLDLASLLLRELEEETAIPPQQVLHLQPFALVRHSSDGTIEACASIHVSDAALDSVHAEPTEYSELALLRHADVEAFFARHSHTLVDLTPYLWRLWQHSRLNC